MKNLEIKKMSIASINGKLTPDEMENVMAGKGAARCALVGFILGPYAISPWNAWIWGDVAYCWTT